MTSLPPRGRKRALWIALVGLCLQVPLGLWLNHLMVLLWAGSEPFGYIWRELVFIAAAAFLLQWWWTRSPHRAERHSGKYLWLAVFWIFAFMEIMVGGRLI